MYTDNVAFKLMCLIHMSRLLLNIVFFRIVYSLSTTARTLQLYKIMILVHVLYYYVAVSKSHLSPLLVISSAP